MGESERHRPAKINIRQMLESAYPAFQKLKGWGCDDDLAGLLVMLQVVSVVSIFPRGAQDENRQVHFRRPDSHELLLNGNSLRYARTRIEQARSALNKYQEALGPFNGARIWQQTDVNLYDIDEALRMLRSALDRFSKALNDTGPKAHPSISASIARIILYVRERTGQYHDAEVAEVISAALGESPPSGYPRFRDADSLKTWRTERGIHASRERKPKSSKS